MLGLEQNCFIKEYRKQVDKEALNQIQDAALSNLMNAFGQMNQTYSVLFKDICLTFGALLSIKEELKDFRQEMYQKQNMKIVQEQILKDMIQQKDQQLENLQKQLKIALIQPEQDRITKQAIQERDQAISSYKQRLFDLQENEQKLLSEKSQLQTRIELLEEQIKGNKVTILEKQTTLHQGYKLTFLNNEQKDSFVEQPSNQFQYENGLNKNKIYSLDNNQVQKNTSLLSKFKQQDQSYQEYSSNMQLAQQNLQDTNQSSKANQMKPESFMNQNPQLFLQESYAQSTLNTSNNLGSKKMTDEEIFMIQKREAEIKKKKQEDEHKKNQEYMSSLNYNKIISDNIKAQNQQNKIIEQSKESSMVSQLNKTAAAFDQNSSTNQSNTYARMELEDASADQQLQKYKLSLKDRKMVVENNGNAQNDFLKSKMEQEDFEKDSSDSQYKWNLKMDFKNNNQQQQQQQFAQESNNNSGNKKRFKKQQLKKSDSFATNTNQNSELENTTTSFVSQQNQQLNQNYEIQDQQSNQMLLGQKKNLNINKGRAVNNKFMKDIELDDESGDKDQIQQNDIFAQFEYKKKGTSNQEPNLTEAFSINSRQNQRPLNPRKKDDREKLKSFNCGRCKAAYQTLGEEFCGNCSRHRSEYTPPHTPEAHYQKFSQSEDDSN
ncbi:hypothetical protein ABPG74_008952 [Tetrahymena malaccensis]